MSADYWKSQGRKFCDFCKCWIADNKPSIEFHEGGKKHKENVSKRLKEIHKNSTKQAKQNKKFEDDLKKMENAAMAAYLKDVENNTRDMTADRIIKEKLNRTTETKDNTSNSKHRPLAAPETAPRYKHHRFGPDVDPCDPILPKVPPPPQSKQQRGPSEHKPQGKSKGSKGKGKGKRGQEEGRPSKPPQKLWYEARTPEGYTYYWHIETNESVWEPPEEGYMTYAEQEEEVREQALQEELLEQLEKEEAVIKADILEEKRANAERERMKELRQQARKEIIKEEVEEVDVKAETTEEGERPYRRDYSIPEKVDPYGPWKTVQTIVRKPVDLQLPRHNKVQVPLFEKHEVPKPQRIFKEKSILQIDADDSDDGGKPTPTTFKRRKLGNKNIRKKLSDD